MFMVWNEAKIITRYILIKINFSKFYSTGEKMTDDPASSICAFCILNMNIMKYKTNYKNNHYNS